MSHDDRPRDAVQPTNHLHADDLEANGQPDSDPELDDLQVEASAAPGGAGKPRTEDSNNPRTRSPADQVKVWEEEGGSPPGQIGATVSVKPKRGTKAGSMGAA